MTKANITPDDPRLTAYALGELEEAEAAIVEAALAADPKLQKEVDEIRTMVGGLGDALESEPLPEVEPAELYEPEGTRIEFPMGHRKRRVFPYYWVSGLAAAGFAVLIMVQSPESPLVGREGVAVGPAADSVQGPARSPAVASSEAPAESAPLRIEVALPEPAVDAASVTHDAVAEPVASVTGDESGDVANRAQVATAATAIAESEPRNESALLSADRVVEIQMENRRAENGLPAAPAQAVAVEEPGLRMLTINPNRDPVAPAQVGSVEGVLNTANKITVAENMSAVAAGQTNTDAGAMELSVSSGSAGSVAKAEVIELSPFTVSTENSYGYAAAPLSQQQLRAEVRERRANFDNRITHTSMAATFAMPMPANVAAGEGYATSEEQGWKRVSDEPLSTFGVDVDSASYANVRRFIQGGGLPPVDAVKIEEMVNAFTYEYQAPAENSEAPLQANLEVASAPWAPQHRLVRIGLKAREMVMSERAPANLVFLLDVSGSMNSPRKLPLVKEAMRMLVDQLEDGDRVAIVTYAGQSGLALPSTPVSERGTINQALAALRPGGSTHGSNGIHLAYDVAKANFVPDGINRVILCTDGDFNVGTTGLSELKQLIAEKAESDVYLTALGFGTGNYQDDTLETLANRGNGQHGYIDSVREARRLLVEQVNGTLATVAQDVKIQVEFNPASVQAYRLIGYNNRRLAAEEFNDDSVDAGEIGAGHAVTALYEVVPMGAPAPSSESSVDSLRYQSVPPTNVRSEHAHEMLMVKLRAQPPGGGQSELFEFPLIDGGNSFERASADFKFAAAVAAFGIQLRQLPTVEQFSLAEVGGWARSGIHSDPGGYRSEFLELVQQADALQERGR